MFPIHEYALQGLRYHVGENRQRSSAEQIFARHLDPNYTGPVADNNYHFTGYINARLPRLLVSDKAHIPGDYRHI